MCGEGQKLFCAREADKKSGRNTSFSLQLHSLSPKVPIKLINAMGSIINKSHFEAKVNLDGGSRVSISASRTKGVLRSNGSTLKKSCQRYLPSIFGLPWMSLKAFLRKES